MSVQLTIDEMLELLLTHETGNTAADGARQQTVEQTLQPMVEGLANTLAAQVAALLDCETRPATFEGVSFGGTCAPFNPKHKGQPFPDILQSYDDGAREEWESALAGE